SRLLCAARASFRRSFVSGALRRLRCCRSDVCTLICCRGNARACCTARGALSGRFLSSFGRRGLGRNGGCLGLGVVLHEHFLVLIRGNERLTRQRMLGVCCTTSL